MTNDNLEIDPKKSFVLHILQRSMCYKKSLTFFNPNYSDRNKLGVLGQIITASAKEKDDVSKAEKFLSLINR